VLHAGELVLPLPGGPYQQDVHARHGRIALQQVGVLDDPLG
jgi:hypothetical protein